MISSKNYKTVNIHITTFKINHQKVNKHSEDMNEDKRNSKSSKNKFICSICLNANKYNNDDENGHEIGKHLPVLKSCELCIEKPRIHIKDNELKNSINLYNNENKLKRYTKVTTESKAVQTTRTDFNKSLNLLNEVLTVFQNKKEMDAKQKSRNVIFKDANISTNDDKHILKPKLRVSKVFQFCIDEAKFDRDDKFTIITSHEDIVRSKGTIDLPKHKSSSIPQMKLEELKHSLKEKTKSKDAIEEVNRMFATVRKKVHDVPEDSNRPLVRHGPRVLPVVKTKDPKNIKECEPHCKCCLTGDCLSSGDSFVKSDNCNHKQNQIEKSDKCVYMMCCHYKNYRKMKGGVMYCEHCNNGRNVRCNHNRDDNFDEKD